jgi:hypothetical protein
VTGPFGRVPCVGGAGEAMIFSSSNSFCLILLFVVKTTCTLTSTSAGARHVRRSLARLLLQQLQAEPPPESHQISTPKKLVRATPLHMVPLFCRQNHPPAPTSGPVPAFAFRSPSHDHPVCPPLAKKYRPPRPLHAAATPSPRPRLSPPSNS